MNENRVAGEQCLRIIREHEKGPYKRPGVRLTEDGAALDAYLCPAGKPTIANGVRKHPDGRPIQLGDSITEADVPVYNAAALERVAVDLRIALGDREVTQNQWDALHSFTYQNGVASLVKSSNLLPAVRAGRWVDAASEFPKFIYATTSKDGLPWKQALRGSLIRRHEEACVLLGYDYAEAVVPEETRTGATTVWQANWRDPETGKEGRFFDEIDLSQKTSFKDVLRVAQLHPLDGAMEMAPAPETSQATLPSPAIVTQIPGPSSHPVPNPASAVPGKPVPKSTETAGASVVIRSPPSPSAAPVSSVSPSGPAGKAGQVSNPRPVPPPVIPGRDGVKPVSPWTVKPEDVHYKINPQAGLKPLDDSDRAKAFVWQRVSMGVIYIGAAGVFGSGFKGASETLMKHAPLMEIFLDLWVPLAVSLTTIGCAYCTKSYGDWKRKRAEEAACQGLF